MKRWMRRRERLVRTVFSDPVAGRELMRRMAAPREGWWRRVFRRRVRVHRAKFGSETVISERWK